MLCCDIFKSGMGGGWTKQRIKIVKLLFTNYCEKQGVGGAYTVPGENTACTCLQNSSETFKKYIFRFYSNKSLYKFLFPADVQTQRSFVDILIFSSDICSYVLTVFKMWEHMLDLSADWRISWFCKGSSCWEPSPLFLNAGLFSLYLELVDFLFVGASFRGGLG